MNKKLKKICALGLMTTIATSILVGCVGSDKATETTSNEGQKKETKVTWWTFQRHDMEYMKEMVDKFNKENTDGIVIDYVVQSENFRQSLDLAFQSNQAPDIFTGQDLAKYYVDKGQVEPFDDYLSEELKARYGAMLPVDGDNAVDGKIYTLPHVGITYRLVYNQDLFDKAGISEPPKDMNELVDYAKRITEMGKSENIYGFATNLKNTQTAVERSIQVIGNRSGFNIYDIAKGEYNFTPYKPIVMAFKQMVDDGSMFPGYESLDIDPLRSQFAQGKIGMYFGGSWEPGVYSDQFKTDINWKSVPVPTVDGEVKGATKIAGLKWMYMSNTCENKEAAWKVIEYFNSDAIQIPYAEKGFGNPVVPTVVEKAQPSSMPGMADFLTGDTDAIWPEMPQERTLKIEGKTFNDVFAAVIMGQADFDTEAEELNKKYNAALKQAIESGATPDCQIEGFDPASLLQQ